MSNVERSFAESTFAMQSFDVFGDVLTSLRIGGSVLLREAYRPPWAIAVPNAKQLADLLGVQPRGHVVAFHLVEFGQCVLETEGVGTTRLAAGEMVVCFAGKPHKISDGKSAKPRAIQTLLAGGADDIKASRSERGLSTSLMCGAFVLHETDLNPLFSALPAVMHASLSRAGEMHNLAGVARLMAEEIDRNAMASGYVVSRLLEVLCAEAVRAHVETSSHHEANWFRAIKDPVVGKAISAIHAEPGEDWSVDRLAQVAAMSASRFAARFAEAMGVSPMAYVASWRMNVARRQLATTRSGVGQIAANVGYESLPAFNRAFKRHVGVPPAAYRDHTHA